MTCMRVREMEKGKCPRLAVHSGRCLLTGLSWRFCLLPLRASAVALLIVTESQPGSLDSWDSSLLPHVDSALEIDARQHAPS